MSSQGKSSAVLARRWTQLCRRQQLARREALARANRPGMDALKAKIPDKTREKLEWAFCKGFNLVFQHGGAVIDNSYDRKKQKRLFVSRDVGFVMDGSSHALRSFENEAFKSDAANMLLTTVEGMGLGALGIGLPDIVLFVGMLLRGIHEAALQYGHGFDSPADKLLILSMLETAMLSGEDWVESDNSVERMMACPEDFPPTKEALAAQLERTASAFATDLLVLKFIQGLPVVGLIGGAANPLYYHKVMSYVRLKYERSYILDAMRRDAEMKQSESN